MITVVFESVVVYFLSSDCVVERVIIAVMSRCSSMVAETWYAIMAFLLCFFRLRGGESHNHGQVEVFQHGSWDFVSLCVVMMTFYFVSSGCVVERVIIVVV